MLFTALRGSEVPATTLALLPFAEFAAVFAFGRPQSTDLPSSSAISLMCVGSMRQYSDGEFPAGLGGGLLPADFLAAFAFALLLLLFPAFFLAALEEFAAAAAAVLLLLLPLSKSAVLDGDAGFDPLDPIRARLTYPTFFFRLKGIPAVS